MPIQSRLGPLQAPKWRFQTHERGLAGRLHYSPKSLVTCRTMTSADSWTDSAQVVQSADKVRTWQSSDGIVFASHADQQLSVERRKRLSANKHAKDVTVTLSDSLETDAPLHTDQGTANSERPKRRKDDLRHTKINSMQVTRSRATAVLPNASLSRHFSNLAITCPDTSVPQPERLFYFMTDDIRSEAQQNSQFWQFGFYKNGNGEKPRLHYCRKVERSEEVARLFLNENVVGFDIEWSIRTYYRSPKARDQSDSIKENVSLIQIASQSRIALFHLAIHHGSTAEELLAPSLKHLLESHEIIKAGVNINNDCTRIEKFLGTQVNSRAELSHLHNLVSYFPNTSKINRRTVALQTLVEEHLGLPICKDDVRTSNWERELEMAQLKYAASDAYAGLQLYHVLNQKRLGLNPIQPMPAYAELKQPIKFVLVDGGVSSSSEEDSPISTTTDQVKRPEP